MQMYNLSGISHAIIMDIIAMVGIVIMIWGELKPKEKLEKMICSVIAIILVSLFVTDMAENVCAFRNPEIESYEGEYIGKSHDGWRSSYSFVDDNQLKKSFSLDIMAKRQVCSESFIKGEKYCIYYEKSTKTIVGEEKLNETKDEKNEK